MSAPTLNSLGQRIRKTSTLICFLPLLVLTNVASAIPLTTWNFAGNNGNEASVNATFVAPGFQTTAITRGGTQSPQVAPDTFSNGSWPFTSALDGYFQFSISPEAGTTYSVSSVEFDLVSNFLGPTHWVLRSDVDAFGSNLDEWIDFSASSMHTTTLSLDPSFQNLTGDRTFRLYGLDSSGGGGGLTRLQINGSAPILSVPETLPFGAFGLTMALLLYGRSRIKK